MGYLQIGCQVLLAAVFVWSAVSKVLGRAAFERFADSLAPIVQSTKATAGVVVAAEISVPPLLVLSPRAGFGAAILLLAVLTTGVIFVVRRRIEVSCRCFGGTRNESLGVRHLVRNLVLIAVACAGALSTLGGSAPVEVAGVTIAAAGALTLATLFIRFDEIAELFA